MSKRKKTVDELLEEVLVPEEEQPYEVPTNWRWIKLKGINKDKKRTIVPSKFNEEIFELYSVPSYPERSPEIIKGQEIGSSKQLVNNNDVLLCKINPRINRVWKVCNEKRKFRQLASTEWIVISENIIIYPNYLLYLLKSPYFRKLLTSNVSGVGGSLTRARPKEVENYPVIIPPLNEQKRIADKVERLLSKIEKAKQLIEEAKETFELRRAAILDKAFRGELTRKWRGENADITTANEWIEQINLLKEGTKTKYKDQLDSSILEKLYELPREWKWVRLNDLIETSTYGTSAKTNDDVTGTPVLRMGNIVDGYLELNNLKYLPNNHEDVLKYDLQTNDLLFNRTNSYELVGKTSVITEDVSERFTFASYLIRVRLFYKDFLASYVSHYINSHVGRKILLSMVTQQVGQANINSQKLASLPIPLPSQEEVMEITSWLNNYRELESKQKEMILVEENIEALKQSILSKAFRGELGTNDLGEESAIELLKDVLQEQVK
ncbi:restriction endonuclease subunit S [Bacillus altitudinis]|uniref:restriction endonuclease subunit S n=1 Tax=Bacillus TaxID=1386 RepID=UPI002281FFD4|nr:restriction endonuclease subunit S [Bacillus altitudinis]MCY7580363.1 restriction endonuclease subunit S [Bacillus altitudinis]MCY7595751.1 restriction endonuclease subunit S [Bacillus altitudinis]